MGRLYMNPSRYSLRCKSYRSIDEMPLCKQCCEVNFSGYRNGKRLRERDPSDNLGFDYWVEGIENEFEEGDDSDSEEERGQIDSRDQRPWDRQLAYDGIRQGQTCELCTLTLHHIEKNGVGAEETVEIKRTVFCSTVNRATYRLSIEVAPESVDNFCGPLEAHEIPQASKNQPRTILQLQESSIVISTTANDGFRTEKDPPWTTHSRFSGRVMNPKADMNLFRDWIRRCETLHGWKCGRSIWPEPLHQKLRSFLVIDVYRMCILKAPESCRYVALSYCWGTAPMLRHLRGNSAELQIEGALTGCRAPATISDAIELVKGIGERYLWVDALCIIQDDPVVKQIQLAQMGLIYSLAAFTIVAAAGDNANAGLPGVRAATRKTDQGILRVGDKVFLTVIDGEDYYGGVKDSTWMTRAWTMQEKILSKKLLIFTDEQVYWKCWNALWLEETALENILKINFFKPIASAGPADIAFDSLVANPMHLYQMLVNTYMERQLSFKADILNAFSGICQAFTAIGNEAFHWGLPVSRFDTALCWWLRAGGQRNYALCDQVEGDSVTSSVPFPSWSWAAWHGSSARGWISWANLEDSKLEQPPEIIIYCQRSDGKLHQTMESRATSNKLGKPPPKDDKTNEKVNIRSEWKLAKQTVEGTSYKGPLNTGFLYFWTSTARLYISREPKSSRHDGFAYFLMELHREGIKKEVHIDATVNLQFEDVDVKLEVPGGISVPSAANKSYKMMAIDFVVVTAYKEKVCALAVEWKDGVAYRIGIVELNETEWIQFRNREWKMITLG